MIGLCLLTMLWTAPALASEGEDPPPAEAGVAETPPEVEAGTPPVVVAETPWGRLGMAVCYDLRFPELFRRMLDLGAEIFSVPSAFTEVTGTAHWEVLVRARAIENLAYVIAPDQGGYHVNGRETHGDSMIVGPWGTILDRLGRGSGFVIAEWDRKRLETLRQSLPSIHHRRIRS